MTSTFRKIGSAVLLGVSLFVTALPFSVSAQDSVVMSVSPTIFDMTANPGQTWRSTVRIINVNSFDLKVSVEVADFVPKGETGTPEFIPLKQNDGGEGSLARWITAEPEVVIPAEQTVEVPFSISLPVDASPGGHFAALMISTKPSNSNPDETAVQTAQVISSLIFLRVTGDITESSSIRSFRTTSYFLGQPEATFELRIENKGNVHLQPRGEIRILNMWGQERGVIPVNQQNLFGNVLPHSVRKYSFTWTGEWSPTDIGRYTAVATLGYGLDQKQFMHADTAFWVIPWKFLLGMIAVVGGFIALMSWAIKHYIRRVLALSGVALNSGAVVPVNTDPGPVSISLTKGRKKGQLATVVAPIEISILDLRARLKRTDSVKAYLITIVGFVRTYWKFFVALVGIIVFVSLVAWFIGGASAPEKEFEVMIEGEGQNLKVSSSDLVGTPVEAEPSPKGGDPGEYELSIVNRSGDPALSDRVTALIHKSGYQVDAATTESGEPEERTVIVYNPKEAEAALALSKILDNALLSSFADTASTSQIVIYLGSETIAKVKE